MRFKIDEILPKVKGLERGGRRGAVVEGPFLGGHEPSARAGWISNPVSTAKSVLLTEQGAHLSRELFEKHSLNSFRNERFRHG